MANDSMILNRQPRPFRVVLKWQLIATAALTFVAWLLWGPDGALSAALGGIVNAAAGWLYGWRVSRSRPRNAGEVLRTLFRAWGMKVLLVVVLLWLVLANYRDLVHAAFFATFVVTVGVFAAAVSVPDAEE